MYEIAIFGGSFDPIHKGHINILQHVHKIKLCNTLYCIPTFHNPHKASMPEASVEDRVQMISLALEEYKLDHVKISEYETSHHEDSFTKDTILYFVNKYSLSSKLALILGADNITDLMNWKHIEIIAKHADLCIIPRPGFDITISKTLSELFKYQILEDISLHNAESHKIRSSVNSLGSHLPKSVHAYIIQKKLYVTH